MDLFLAAGLKPYRIRRIFSPFSLKAWSLHHSSILLSKNWSMPAIVTTGRVFSTNQPAYGLFLAAGLEPPRIRRIFCPFSSKARSLSHSSILLPKIWSMPAIVTTGRDFSTNRPAYGLFWQQDSNLLVSGVYLVRSPQRLGALATRPSCCPKFGLCQP